MEQLQKKNRCVCLLMGYYDYALHSGIAKYAYKAGWILDAFMARSGIIPANWHGDGIISYHGRREEIISKIRQENVPTVDLDINDSGLHLTKVLHDEPAIGHMAGEHLVQCGLREIGYVKTTRNLKDQQRMDGLKEVVLAHQRNFHEMTIEAILDELKEIPKPVGLMAQNDQIALDVIRICTEAGYSVPDDIAVIGADNDTLHCELALVPLTSVDNALEEIGYRAAELLDKLMDGEQPPSEPILVPPQRVVPRQSTNLLAVPHPQTAKALRFIREHLHEPISVEQVADLAGMCRRRLDDAFKQYIGRSISNEITRLRLEYVKKRLKETDLKTATIAREVQFSGPSHLGRLFKKEYGMTPREFRTR